jgi:hypothetical protein
MTKLTAKLIKKLNPCKDRFDNFLKEYPNYKGDWYDFLSLDRISYEDKIWVAARLMNKEQLVRWSILCAESVLYIYEAKHPESKEVRNLLEYLNKIESFESLSNEQKELILKKRKSVDASAAYDTYAVAAASAAASVYDYAKEEQRCLNLLYLTSVVIDD